MRNIGDQFDGLVILALLRWFYWIITTPNNKTNTLFILYPRYEPAII